jgi:hypothetical protein
MVKMLKLQLLHSLPTLQVKVQLSLSHSLKMLLLQARLIKKLREESHPKLTEEAELVEQMRQQKLVQIHQHERTMLPKVAPLSTK